jgi:hypothetical protein
VLVVISCILCALQCNSAVIVVLVEKRALFFAFKGFGASSLLERQIVVFLRVVLLQILSNYMILIVLFRCSFIA